jgi:hypothetical protein
MKLRILGDSLRLRLRQSEVAAIGAGQSVVEQTRFPGAVLTYRLEVTDDEHITADFDGGNVTVRLPKDDAATWASTDQVSLLGENGDLTVLLEKDFQCLSPGHHRPDEDDEDTYPHPEAGTGKGC